MACTLPIACSRMSHITSNLSIYCSAFLSDLYCLITLKRKSISSLANLMRLLLWLWIISFRVWKASFLSLASVLLLIKLISPFLYRIYSSYCCFKMPASFPRHNDDAALLLKWLLLMTLSNKSCENFIFGNYSLPMRLPHLLIKASIT